MSDTIRIEEVDAVETPPRARVDDAAEPRQRDYLSGFLQQKPQGDAPSLQALPHASFPSFALFSAPLRDIVQSTTVPLGVMAAEGQVLHTG